ncbi:MAG: response regulator [Burkholderiaceae bacterium]
MNAVETEVATPGQSVSLRCLILDDDRVSRQLMVSAGRLLSLELRETGCANEAMNWLQQERFDLVLLDHQLDGLTGLSVLAYLADWAEQRRVVIPPVIVCSGAIGLIDMKQYQTLRVHDVLKKPLSMDRLAFTMRKLLKI